jgi:prepilin-type N-terminal cleavage/methylation domain-containing protein
MQRILIKEDPGFTLIEIMIVISILGILAAIAVPQFLTYKQRSYNSTAKTLVHNLKSDNANLFSELGVYGHTESAAALLSDDDGGAGEADTFIDPALSSPSTVTVPGSRLSGTTFDTSRKLSISVSIGRNLVAYCIDINNVNNQSSFNVFARHIKGDTAYAIDGDIENSIFSVSNPSWVNSGGLRATPANPTLTSSNDIANFNGGGLPTTAWTVAY